MSFLFQIFISLICRTLTTLNFYLLINELRDLKDLEFIGLFSASSEIRRIEGTHKSRLLSTTRFLDIKQGRDDAEFQCRLVNRSKIDGFVSSVERSVLISVDCK